MAANLENVKQGIWRNIISPIDTLDESSDGEVSWPNIYQQVGCGALAVNPANTS